MRPENCSSGFTLPEILVAVLVLGIVSIGAVRLYTTTFGVQHTLAREFDLRQEGLRILNEIGSGFEWNGVGVHGANEVELLANPHGLRLVAGGTAIVYAWNQSTQTLTRQVGSEPAQIVLNGAKRFDVECESVGGGKIIVIRLTLVAEGSPQPQVDIDISLRPRVADPVCN